MTQNGSVMLVETVPLFGAMTLSTGREPRTGAVRKVLVA